MREERARLSILITMVLLTTAFALLGVGKGSAGALARTIECNHKLQHHLSLARQGDLLSNSPPPLKPGTCLALLSLAPP